MTRSSDRRIWARITVDFADSPKVVVLSDAAFRALVEMILWCRRGETDGVIPRVYADRRWGYDSYTSRTTDPDTSRSTDPITELRTNHPERPSLEVNEAGDYVLRDFLEHQDSREQVAKRVARNSANIRRRWERRDTARDTSRTTDPDTSRSTSGNTETETETEEEVLRTSSLSPATPESARATTTKPRKRHKPTTPIPDDWAPTPEHRARAAAAGVDVDHEAEMFRAHAEANDRWQASWNAAFTTWLGKSAQRAAEQRSRQGYRNQAQIMQDVHRQAQEATIAMRRQQGSALQLIAGEAS